nr:retrovirus-related Pol polyprotein from transposon TNT 1-94 [Tanacetum cinerariifolium]
MATGQCYQQTGKKWDDSRGQKRQRPQSSLRRKFFAAAIIVLRHRLEYGIIVKVRCLVWGCEAYVKRDSADKFYQRSVKCIFVGYPKDLISQKFSGKGNDLENDYMDTLPSENTSEIPVESESLGSPPELIPVRRSERTTRAPNRLCLNIEVEDDEVRDLGEPANYKAAMLDPDKKYNMRNSKKGYLPMEVKHDLSNELCASTPEEVAYMKKVPYASAVGSIMYAVRCTRPDVAFAQNLVSRYQQNPGKL